MGGGGGAAAAKVPATSGKLNACVNKPQSDSDIMRHVRGLGVEFGFRLGSASRQADRKAAGRRRVGVSRKQAAVLIDMSGR